VDGQHSRLWRRRLTASPITWLSALVVVILAGWGSVAFLDRMLRPSGCTAPTSVQIAAAPAVATAIAEVARTAVDPKACYEVEVVARDSNAFSDALASPPASPLPQAWVPESTFWLRRAQAKGAFEVPDRGTSIANSPVVLAMTEPVALQLGWPATPVPWSALLDPGNTSIPVGLPDPAVDPVGIGAIMGIRSVTARQPDPTGANVAVLRRLSPYAVANSSELYQRLPEYGNAQGTLNAFVTTEQAMLHHNTRRQATQLVASYPQPAVPSMDFPFVVLPGATSAQRATAAKFLSALLSPAAGRILGAESLRAPDGTVLDASQGDTSAGPSTAAPRAITTTIPPVALPDDDALVQLLTTWTGVHLSARILGVIDTSGSMSERVAAGGDTRLGATIKAAQQGVGLLLNTTEVGVWVFSTNLDGDRDYRVVFPTRSLSEGRGALLGALGGIKVQPNGNTGLYDTTLAAYQDARRNWTPGRINIVLIATDGQNDDAHSISRAQLIGELTKLNDPRRPLPILFIGIGGGIDPKELNDIANATGGKVYLSKDPSGIRQIFFNALGDLACQPPTCKR
jgi:hypothetical protein